jgi:hypothetical protein
MLLGTCLCSSLSKVPSLLPLFEYVLFKSALLEQHANFTNSDEQIPLLAPNGFQARSCEDKAVHSTAHAASWGPAIRMLAQE